MGNHFNPIVYPDPYTFSPWRFYDLRSLPGNENRYQFVTTSVDAITFGHGTHSCPGRFFASSEIKLILAGLIRRYDIKLKDGEGRPENLYRGTSIVPNPTAEVLFRKRQASG